VAVGGTAVNVAVLSGVDVAVGVSVSVGTCVAVGRRVRVAVGVGWGANVSPSEQLLSSSPKRTKVQTTNDERADMRTPPKVS
jgi:hypothetical protein